MKNSNNWHIGINVRSLIYSSICHIGLWYDRRANVLQYCYKKGVIDYNLDSSVVLFQIEPGTLEVKEFYPMSLLYTENNVGLGIAKSRTPFGVVEKITFLGEEVPFSDFEKMLFSYYKQRITFIEKENALSYSPLSDYRLEEELKKIKKKVESYDLESILRDMRIKTEGSHVGSRAEKIYEVWQETTINYPLEELDSYLIKHFQLNGFNLSEQRGYPDAFDENGQRNFYIGEYTDTMVAEHKAKLLSTYSKVDHCNHLLFKHIQEIGYTLSQYIRASSDYRKFYNNKDFTLLQNVLHGRNLITELCRIDKSADMINGIRNISDSSLYNINKMLRDICHSYNNISF